MKKVLLAVMMMGSVAMLAACGSKPCEMSWEVPEGFTSDDGMIYVSEDYPYDSSNVAYVYSENDPLGIDFDAEEYEEMIESQFYLHMVFL